MQNKTYTAVFMVPAMVEYRVQVSAPNQTEGLVLAHDAIRSVPLSDGKISEVNFENAVSQAFFPDTAETEAASDNALEKVVTVEFFDTLDLSLAPKVTLTTSATKLQGLSNAVISGFSEFAALRASDNFGVVLTSKSPRGKWEVLIAAKDTPAEAHSASPLEHIAEVECRSWLSYLEAKAQAIEALQSKTVAWVAIVDYQDRTKGAVVHRVLK